MVDAREFNRRFILPIVDTCKYLLSSQCDHETLKLIPRDQVWLWHSGDSAIVNRCLDEWSEYRSTKREWFPVFGGTTVVSRALVLLAMLGFRKVEVFGWDSCIMGDEHHAYPQPENDSSNVINVTVGNRTFRCHGWMAVQAGEFTKIVRHILGRIEDFEMVVHGDGLIAHLLNHSAGLAASTEN